MSAYSSACPSPNVLIPHGSPACQCPTAAVGKSCGAPPPSPRPLAGAGPHGPEPTPERRRQPGRKDAGVTLADLISAGLLKGGVRLFREYKAQMLEAMLLATGEIEVGGRRYANPSAAAVAARETVTGRKMSTNGWEFWQTEVEGKAQTLGQARRAYLKRKG
jgi:hypothetical protein